MSSHIEHGHTCTAEHIMADSLGVYSMSLYIGGKI